MPLRRLVPLALPAHTTMALSSVETPQFPSLVVLLLRLVLPVRPVFSPLLLLFSKYM